MFKKVISILLSAVIILSGFTLAFADDSEDLSSSELSAEELSAEELSAEELSAEELSAEELSAEELSAEELSFIEAAYDDNDRNIRTLAVEVVRASSSSYTIDDVYSLLIALITTQHNGLYEWKVYDTSIYNQINNNFSHYDSASGNTYDTGAMLWNIRQTLNDIELELVPAAASNLPSIYELISSIDDTLTDIISAIPQPVNYTSALFYHNIGIAQMFDSFKTNNLNYLYSINNNISSILTNTSNIKSNTDTLVSNTNTIHNDLGSSGAIAQYIQSFETKYNTFFEYSSTTPALFYDNSSEINITSGYPYYVFIPMESIIEDSIIDIRLFVNGSNYSYRNNPNIKIAFSQYDYPNTLYPLSNYYSYWLQGGQYAHIYLYNGSFKSNYSYLVLYTENTDFGYLRSTNVVINYLSKSNPHYFEVMESLSTLRQEYILKKFESLYASNDQIAAKQSQQNYEDQVLSDFTGSGSASAKASDATSAKNISSTVSSGLTSGGSVNNSLSVFQTNSGFWGWFSQENSNYINNLSSQQRSLSSSGSDWVDDNPYQRNAEELQSILGGNR